MRPVSATSAWGARRRVASPTREGCEGASRPASPKSHGCRLRPSSGAVSGARHVRNGCGGCRSHSAQPRARAVFGRPEWSTSHHVGPSRANTTLPRNCRAYFDDLHAVHVKAGEFVDVHAPRFEPHSGPEEIQRRMSRFPQFWGRVKKTTFPMMALSIASRCFNKPPLQPLYQLPDHAILVSESDDASQTQLQPQPPSGVRPPCARPGRAAVSSSLNRDGADGEAADMKSFRREKVDVGASRQRLENEDYRLLVEWCEKKRMHLYKLFRTLDVDKSMNVSRREFQKGMKDLRYPSDIDKLWSYLDNDTTGTISFLEFMPREALDMARFKAWSLENFGNMKATFDAMDTNGNGRVNWTEFDKVCTEKGLHSRLQGSIESLYKLFDVDAKGTGGAATVDDFLLLDAWKPPEYLWAEPNVQAREKFQAELFRRYNHNPIMAWRRALDTDSSMRVNYDEFAAACRKLNRAGFDCARLAGGIGRLFTAYDVERNGYFSLRDFDGNAFRLLAMFSVWVFRQSDRVSNWIRSLEETPNEGVSLTAFRQAVKSMALDTEDMEQLFEGLSLEKVSRGAGVTKAGRITVQEAIFLDRWNPAQDCGDDECWSRILAAVRSPPLTQTAEK